MKRASLSIKSIMAGISAILSAVLYSVNTFAYDGAILHTNDGKEGIMEVLNIVVDVMTAGIAILAVIGIVISGVQYLTASGNEEQLKKSKRRIFEIIIGLAAYVAIFALLKWLLPTFNGANGQ